MPASTMFGGVAKSGCPIPKLMIERPSAASRFASASTSNAVSVPIRPTAATASTIIGSLRAACSPQAIPAAPYRERP